MINPVVSAHNASKSYKGFRLGPVDLDIEPGYVVAVVGPNGSGKTTLFRMLMNLTSPESGQVELFGERYPENEVTIKQRIGYMPESPIGYEEMTAAALADFVSFWYPNWDQRCYDELLTRTEIPSGKPYGQLSKGMQRRVSFALARASNADLLLLDEPTAGVDPFARREMMDEISRFMQDGERTVLMATHVMEEVRRLCDYIVLVLDGRFIGLYEKDSLIEQWRSFWVDREPAGPVPGVMQVDPGTPVRLVTSEPEATRAALNEAGIQVVRTGPLDLDEILGFLMRERTTA
jgi:ABC-2 type transport system ATP-binding protein